MESRIDDAIARLRRAQADGALDALCSELQVEVLTLHGSVARGEADPHDIDLAVRFVDGAGDTVALVNELIDLLRTDALDVMDLGRASVTARARGLAHGAEPLFEATPGAYARAQMAALGLQMDFAPLRAAQLRMLAGR